MLITKLCKYCRKELKENDGRSRFCSLWCKEEHKLLRIKPKIKKAKIERFCSCGNKLVRFARFCDECRIIRRKGYKKHRELEYISCGKCLQCGEDCLIRNGAKTKKICSIECQRKYYKKAI